MKKSRLLYISIISLCCVFIVSGVVFANGVWEDVTIYYDNIKIKVNDTYIDLTNANNETIEPFIINGTTYVPIRAVSEAMGKKVMWDGNEKVVYISDYTNSHSLISKPYEYCSDFNSLEIKNNEHDNDSFLNFTLTPHNSDFSFCEYITYNIEGNNRLTCRLLPPQSDNKSEITYTLRTGGTSEKVVTLTNSSEPVDIDMNINEKRTITIYMEGKSASDNVVIGSIQNLMVWQD